jgi:phosphate/sulfate permease
MPGDGKEGREERRGKCTNDEEMEIQFSISLSCSLFVSVSSSYVYTKVVKKDYSASHSLLSGSIVSETNFLPLAAIRWYPFFFGPALWFRPAPADAADRSAKVVDYRLRKEAEGDVVDRKPSHDAESGPSSGEKVYEEDGISAESHPNQQSNLVLSLFPMLTRPRPYSHGLTYDIHAAQAGEAHTSEGKRIDDMYSRAKQYPNEVETTFSFVQVLTACSNSFAHGANGSSFLSSFFPFSFLVLTLPPSSSQTSRTLLGLSQSSTTSTVPARSLAASLPSPSGFSPTEVS